MDPCKNVTCGSLALLSHHIGKYLNHGFVDQAIRGKDLIPQQHKRSARKVRDAPPGLGHHQNAGSFIPRIKFQFPEALKSSRSHRAKVKRCRAGPTNAMRKLSETEIIPEIQAMVSRSGGKSGCEQAFRKFLGF